MLTHDNTKATVRKVGQELTPTIIFPIRTLVIMRFIVNNCGEEVGWLGTVDNPRENCYIVTDIHVPSQEVNGGTCELTPEGLFELYEDLIKQDKEEDAEKIRFWGHSHCNGGVTPSQQDEVQSLEMLKNNGDFLIRGICNKEGKMSVSFFDAKMRHAFDNIPWLSDDGVDRNEIKALYKPIIDKNVKEFKEISRTTVSGNPGNIIAPSDNHISMNQYFSRRANHLFNNFHNKGKRETDGNKAEKTNFTLVKTKS